MVYPDLLLTNWGPGLVTLYVEPKYDLTDRELKILNDRYDKEHPEQKKEASKESTEEKKEETKKK